MANLFGTNGRKENVYGGNLETRLTYNTPYGFAATEIVPSDPKVSIVELE